MKKTIITILTLCGFLVAETGVSLVGAKQVKTSLLTFTSQSKTRLRLLATAVAVDTSSTGQAGEWKTISGTADSCSNPFLITSDTAGGTKGLNALMLWETVRATNVDSSAHVWRFITRRMVKYHQRAPVYTSYTRARYNVGVTDMAIVDTIKVPNTDVTSKHSTYGLARVMGHWAKACPSHFYTGAGTDTLYVDSVYTEPY